MGSTDSAYAVIEFDTGKGDEFPDAYHQKNLNDLGKGCVLLESTLEEMQMIKDLGIDLNNDIDFIFNTRLKVQALNVKRAKLESQRKTFNPIKALLKYKAARSFHEASLAVWLETKHTTEKIQRESAPKVPVIPSAQMRRVNVSPGTRVKGVAVYLPNGFDENARRTIVDARETITTAGPFEDNLLISQLRDGEHEITLASTESMLSQDEDVSGSGVDGGNRSSIASSDLQQSLPTTATTIIHIHNYENSLVTTNSNLNAVTYSHGSGNSGAPVTQEFAL